MSGVNGLAGWQWMFLIEAIPSVVIGLIVLVVLDDRIRDAKWLNDAEKSMLERNIASDVLSKEDLPLRRVFSSPACG